MASTLRDLTDEVTNIGEKPRLLAGQRRQAARERLRQQEETPPPESPTLRGQMGRGATTVASGSVLPTPPVSAETANANVLAPQDREFSSAYTLRRPEGTLTAEASAVDRARAQAPALIDKLIASDPSYQAQQKALRGLQLGRENAIEDAYAPILGRSPQNPFAAIDEQINSLRNRLATPSRGLNQSFDSLQREAANKRNAKASLKSLLDQRDSLVNQQKAGAASALQQQRFGLDQAKFQRDLRNDAIKEVDAKREAASKDRSSSLKFLDNYFAQQGIEDPRQQNFAAVALRARNDPGILNTTRGKAAERVAKETLVNALKDERGFLDFLASVTGLKGPSLDLSDPDVLDSFKLEDIFRGKGNAPPPEFLFGPNNTLRVRIPKPGGAEGETTASSDYAYIDNLDPVTYDALHSLIAVAKQRAKK